MMKRIAANAVVQEETATSVRLKHHKCGEVLTSERIAQNQSKRKKSAPKELDSSSDSKPESKP